MTDQKESSRPDLTLAMWVIGAGIIAFTAYFLFFNFSTSYAGTSPNAWALFGDYFGGVVNPVVGIVTALLVVMTLQVTRAEAADTRREMNAQTQLLEAQANEAKRAFLLMEMQKRLDGLLEAWNRVLQKARMNLTDQLLCAPQMGHTVSLDDLINDPSTARDLDRLMKSGDWMVTTKTAWERNFFEPILMLNEFARYCEEYEKAAGNTVVSDFYKRRVRSTKLLLRQAQLIDEALADRLSG